MAPAETNYLGSADLMQRNLYHRVEMAFPIEDPHYVEHLRAQRAANLLPG